MVLNHWSRPLKPEDLPESDMAVATLWNTAYNLLRYHRTKAKFYLIQDYETRFYPGSVESALADLTYDLGFLGLFNTPGLRDAVLAEHAMTGSHAFQPGIDHDVFYPPQSDELPDLRRMFFYGRPEVARNGYSLGMQGLQLIQEEFADSEVFVAGHPKAYAQSALRGQFLPYMDYRATGEMYRSCGSLISFMFTPHPSYIPLQAMTCGSIPFAPRPFHVVGIEGWRELPAGESVPTRDIGGVPPLRQDRDLHRHLYENAIRTFDGITWADQLDRAYRWMTAGNSCESKTANRPADGEAHRDVAARPRVIPRPLSGLGPRTIHPRNLRHGPTCPGSDYPGARLCALSRGRKRFCRPHCREVVRGYSAAGDRRAVPAHPNRPVPRSRVRGWPPRGR